MRKYSAIKIAGLVLAVALIVYFVVAAAYALGGRNELVYEKRDYATGAAGINEIRIITRNMPVTLTAYEGSDVTIGYYTSEKDPYEVTLANGVLTLKYKRDVLYDITSWFSGLFKTFTTSTPRVDVAVPAAFAGNLQLDASNAAVNTSGLTAAKGLRVRTSNGPVSVTGVTCDQLSAHTSNGPVTLESVIVSGAADVKSSNGPVIARQVAARDRLRLETSNGPVLADRVASGNIELLTSNSGISGSVAGRRADYTISSSTSNGRNGLGDGGNGQSRLTVRTSNGNIDVQFLDE